MSDDPATRPTVPKPPKLHTVIGLPLSSARAHQLATALDDYAQRCIDVKKALVALDDGVAYREARKRKHAQYNEVLRVVDNVLAHIGVHAHE